MRHRSFILVAVVLLVLIGGAVAAFAYDSSRDDVIAEGVTIAGVDVGGMKSVQARDVVRRELQEPLERPIAVRRGEQRFTLSAHDAGVKADVGGMVDEALEASRDGSIFTRVARDITGGEENAQVSARVTYSTEAVEQLVKRVESKLNRPARDAEVDFPSLEKVKEEKGRTVRAAMLQQRIAQALTVPGVKRTVRAPVRILRPKVTQAELADKYPVVLVADRYNFKLRLYKNLRSGKGVHGRGRARSASTPPPGSTTSRTRRWTRPGTCRTATGPAISRARWCRAGRPRTRSRRAGWASSTAPGSTAPTRPTR